MATKEVLDAKQLNICSRKMITILRHRAEQHNLDIKSDGYVKLGDLLSVSVIRKYHPTLEDVKTIVATCAKQRFGLMKDDNDVYYIRANQGHTMSVVKTEDLLDEIKSADDFPNCVHGTYWKYWKHIRNKGLHKMKRNHIHFAPGEKISGPDAVISGMRKTAQVLIFIDLEKAMQDGIRFFKASNDVILTEGVDGWIRSKYFKKVVTRDGESISLVDEMEAKEDTKSKNGGSSQCAKTPEQAALTTKKMLRGHGRDFNGIQVEQEGRTTVILVGELAGKNNSKRYAKLLKRIRDKFPGVDFRNSVELQK